MAHYFPGRLKVGEQFEVVGTGHRKVVCTIFKIWVEKPGYECACGDKVDFKVTKTWGISEKESETIESTVKSSLGREGLAELKSSIKGVLGHEVQWSYSKAVEQSYSCDPPKCGCKEVKIFGLVYEYELVGYRRGYLFKKHVWDRRWARTIREEVGSIASWPDVSEYDERCKGCEEKASPEFDGRLSVDAGNLCLVVPFKMNREQLQIRVGKYGVSFKIWDYQSIVRSIDGRGLTLTLQRTLIDPALLFLSGLDGETVEGNARLYWDEGTGRPELQPAVNLKEVLAIHDIGSGIPFVQKEELDSKV